MNNIVVRIALQPKRYLAKLILKFSFCLTDKLYLKAIYMYRFGHSLDLDNPKTFCEKLQWLKLYDRKPEYTQMVDKYDVKKYVANIIGEEYIIPTLGVWNKPQDIDWGGLPNQFVLKTTHGGGGNGVVICKDKTKIKKEAIYRVLLNSLRTDLYRKFREWPYKNVPKRIIAEAFLATPSGELKDYKFFCFDGVVKFFKIDFGRFVEHHANYYLPNGQILPFGEKGLEPDFGHVEIMPDNLSKMTKIAEELSKGCKFVRVDLYNVKGKIYFGELTFYPASGLGELVPCEWNEIVGGFISI